MQKKIELVEKFERLLKEEELKQLDLTFLKQKWEKIERKKEHEII